MVANPAPGHLKRENKKYLSRFAPENLVSRDKFAVPSRVSPSFSTPRLNLVLTHRLLSLVPLSATKDYDDKGVHLYRQAPS